MVALLSARAAMDTHRGVAAVAEEALGFLSSQAWADANKVRRVLCSLCGLLPVHFVSMTSVSGSVTRSVPLFVRPVTVLCVPGTSDGGTARGPSSHGCPSRRGGRGEGRWRSNDDILVR